MTNLVIERIFQNLHTIGERDSLVNNDFEICKCQGNLYPSPKEVIEKMGMFIQFKFPLKRQCYFPGNVPFVP